MIDTTRTTPQSWHLPKQMKEKGKKRVVLELRNHNFLESQARQEFISIGWLGRGAGGGGHNEETI